MKSRCPAGVESLNGISGDFLEAFFIGFLEGTCFFFSCKNMCCICWLGFLFKIKEEVEIMQQKSSDICQSMEKRRQKRHVMSIVPTSDIREALERCTGPFYIPG